MLVLATCRCSSCSSCSCGLGFLGGRCSSGLDSCSGLGATSQGGGGSSCSACRDFAGLGPPDFLGILLDGPVAGELAHTGNVVDHHLEPLLAVLVDLRNCLLALDVGLIIC